MKPSNVLMHSMLASISLMLSQTVLPESSENLTSAIEETEILGTYKKNSFQDKERTALNVVDTLDAAAIERFGDSAAGDAVKRVVGVSLVDSKYAVIRGLKGRFIASTLNSSTMPSLNPTRRDVALDIFPSSILGGIEIEKSYRPELPGNTTGGLINLVTKNPNDDPTNKLSIGLGMTTGVTGKEQVTYKGSKTDMLGFDSGMRKMPSSIDNATNFGEPGTSTEVRFLGGDFNAIYNTKKAKAQPDIKLSYALGDTFDSDAGALSFYTATNYKNGTTARQNAKITGSDGEFNYERSVKSVDISGYLALGFEDPTGNHNITSKTLYLRQANDTTRVDKGINNEDKYEENVTLQWIENTYLSQQFSGSHDFLNKTHNINWLIAAGQTHRYEPDRRQFTIQGYKVDGTIGGKQPLITTVERRFGDMTEDNIDFGLNYSANLNINDMVTSTIKAGLYTQTKKRTAKIARFGFSNRGIDVKDKTFEELLSEENFNTQSIVTRTNTEEQDIYNAKETLTAAYLSTETTFIDQIDLLAGARMEEHEQTLRYPHLETNDTSIKSNDILPVLGITYRLDDSWLIRASTSQTVSRPGLTELSESTFYDPETDDRFLGNPDLKRSTIQNYDLRTEYYWDDQTSVSLAFFLKDIDAPIEITKASCSSGACGSYTFNNQKSARLQGVELDFSTSLFETGDWSSFLNGNFTYVDSTVKLTKTSQAFEFNNPESRRLQGQSDMLTNLQIGVDHIPTEQQLSISANYFSDRIHRIESDEPNQVEEGRIKLDLVYQWNLYENFALKANINNILNSKTIYKRLDTTIESYQTGVGINVSVGMHF